MNTRFYLSFRKDPVSVLRDPLVMQAPEVLVSLVADVLAANGEAARIFLDRHMGCVGCPFAAFETVAEAAAIYGVDPDELAASLAGVAVPSKKGSPV